MLRSISSNANIETKTCKERKMISESLVSNSSFVLCSLDTRNGLTLSLIFINSRLHPKPNFKQKQMFNQCFKPFKTLSRLTVGKLLTKSIMGASEWVFSPKPLGVILQPFPSDNPSVQFLQLRRQYKASWLNYCSKTHKSKQQSYNSDFDLSKVSNLRVPDPP